MYCTKCGAAVEQNDRCCPRCGEFLKHGELSAASAGRKKKIEKPKASEKSSGGKGKIVAATAVAAVVICAAVFAIGALNNDNVTVPSNSDANGVVSAVDANAQPAPSASTSATAAATTATAKPTTTTTANSSKKKEAEEIRSLMVSKKWKTEIEGYEAEITFKSNGTAKLTVYYKLGFISLHKSIDAKYSVNDKCHVVVTGEFEGSTYGISGTISKKNDKTLVVERDKNKGTITLTAA